MKEMLVKRKEKNMNIKLNLIQMLQKHVDNNKKKNKKDMKNK